MAEGNSKKSRRTPHAGRSRGSVIRTGESGGARTRLTPLQGILINNSGPLGHRLRVKGKLARPMKKSSRGDGA